MPSSDGTVARRDSFTGATLWQRGEPDNATTSPTGELTVLRNATFALVLTALLLATGSTAAAGSIESAAPTGIDGHTITFRVTSPDVDQACVSYYETTKKGGPALHPPVTIDPTSVPFKAKVGVGSKVRHWHITAYAAQDCEATDPPKGTVKCELRVDGKVKAKATGKDKLVFCYV